MLVLVTYDIDTTSDSGKQRLRSIAKVCKNYGQRVQKSVFECLVDPALWVEFSKKIEDVIDPTLDSVRIYFLGSNWKRRVDHIGVNEAYDPEGVLIV